jgi:hypothetical protein
MFQSTAHLLVVVMLLASGRLLACGWECLDELAAPVAASCHQEFGPDRSGLPTVALAKVGNAPHACLPDVVEPRVRAPQPVAAQSLTAAPVVVVFVTADRSLDALPRHRHARHSRFESPHLPAPAVLRL